MISHNTIIGLIEQKWFNVLSLIYTYIHLSTLIENYVLNYGIFVWCIHLDVLNHFISISIHSREHGWCHYSFYIEFPSLWIYTIRFSTWLHIFSFQLQLLQLLTVTQMTQQQQWSLAVCWAASGWVSSTCLLSGCTLLYHHTLYDILLHREILLPWANADPLQWSIPGCVSSVHVSVVLV